MEEVHSFTIVTSPPLGTNLVKSVAIGTSHMAAITGKIFLFNINVKKDLFMYLKSFSDLKTRPEYDFHVLFAF